MEQQLKARLRHVFGEKSWIVAGEVAQGIAGGAIALQSLGATRTLCIASRVGVGELPEELRFIFTDDSRVAEDADMVQRMHDNNRELHDLPQWVIDEVDEWDPDRQAQVIVSFTIDDGLVASRPTFGARRPEWAALEDKIAIRSLWAAAGIATTPDRVVALDDLESAIGAHQDLATTLGTVWAVDNKLGWHGGGTGTHWVSSPERAQELAQELAPHHDAVRVQPFLEGVPCSIHGLVLADVTLALRPCEMIMLLDHENHDFVYSRTATFWDPSAADRNAMRQTARLVGDVLRDSVDFRGVFTLDGVLTADGFRPTEVNPRFGAALPPRLPLADGTMLPLFFTHLAAVTENLGGLDPAGLEQTLLDLLDSHRAGSAFIFTSKPPPDGAQSVTLGADLHVVDNDDPTALATIAWGNDPNGGLIFVTFTDQMPTGPPVAPTIVAIRERLNTLWDLGLPTVTAASETSRPIGA